MKKIIFLTTEISDKTGGQIYNGYFYKKLITYSNFADGKSVATFAITGFQVI